MVVNWTLTHHQESFVLLVSFFFFSWSSAHFFSCGSAFFKSRLIEGRQQELFKSTIIWILLRERRGVVGLMAQWWLKTAGQCFTLKERGLILTYCVFCACQEVYRSRADYQLATDHCNHQQLRAHFLAWMHHCRDLKRAEWEKERKALVHNNK